MISPQFTLDILASPEPSLDNFVSPASNLWCPVSILTVLENIQKNYQHKNVISPEFNLIYLWGPVGSGKSHLLIAMKRFFELLQLPHLYLTHQHSNWQFADIQTGPDCVAYLIDDIEYLNDAEKNQVFKLLIDQKQTPDKFIFVTGKCSSHHLEIRTDISSRLASGLNFELSPLTDQEKILALEEFIKGKGLNISNDILHWLLTHWHRDMPNLISIIEAVDQYSLQTKRPITLPLLKKLLNIST